MPIASIDGRALISVTGADAQHFLQNLVTTDIDQLGSHEVRPGALLTPQGKILHSFLVSHVTDGFVLECDAASADDFSKRLMLYRMRAKVAISSENQASVRVSWDPESSPSQEDSTAWLADVRFPATAGVLRSYGQAVADAEASGFDVVRIASGVAEAGRDFEDGEAFPHDVGLDQTHGVSFRKGCYVGQEVVSRMQHRGTARRRIVTVSADEALPATGTELTADGKPVGRLGTIVGNSGLALVRLDRVADALAAGIPVEAKGVVLAIHVPPGVTYSLDGAGQAED